MIARLLCWLGRHRWGTSPFETMDKDGQVFEWNHCQECMLHMGRPK